LIKNCCAITKTHGTVIHIAQPDSVVVSFQELIFRDSKVRGSLICSPGEERDLLYIVAEYRISTNMKRKGIVIMDEKQVRREKDGGLDTV